MASDKWSYAEVNEWDLKCNKANQSPINIDSQLIQPCRELCELEFLYEPSKCLVEFIKNQNLKIIYDSGSGVIFKKNYYKLVEITFHTPSMHKIDGNLADLEICLVHSLTDSALDDNGLIISCLYNSGKHYGGTESFINQFINDVTVNSKKNIEVSSDWNAMSVIPENKSFFLYEGSMPYPPCTLSVEYIVMDRIGNIGPTNLDLLKINLGNNIRPLQTKGDRQVFYNSGNNIQTLNQRVITKSDDKFLRCKKKPKDNFKIKLNEKTNKAETEKPEVSQGFGKSFKNTIKLFSTIVVFLILVINSYYFVKYLFRNDHAQKLVISIVGINSYKNSSGEPYIKSEDLLNEWRSLSRTGQLKNTTLKKTVGDSVFNFGGDTKVNSSSRPSSSFGSSTSSSFGSRPSSSFGSRPSSSFGSRPSSSFGSSPSSSFGSSPSSSGFSSRPRSRSRY